MNYSGDAAEQVVRMSLSGVEVAAKLTGKAAERLAVLLYAVLRDQKRTKGKIRLTNMLKSGKELKVFAVKDSELQKFCREAKKYGVLYCVLKDNKATDGLTDIMVRAEDAGKVNRIFERFNLAKIDMGSIKTEIEQVRKEAPEGEVLPVPERTGPDQDPLEAFLEGVVKKEDNPTMDKPFNQNPTTAPMTKSRPSEPSSEIRDARGGGAAESREARARPSVRAELEDIRRQQRQKLRESNQHRQPRQNTHRHVPNKKRPKKGAR